MACLQSQLELTLENHCTQTVQSSQVYCSQRRHKKVYPADKKGNIFVNILLLKIFFTDYVTHISSCVSI